MEGQEPMRAMSTLKGGRCVMIAGMIQMQMLCAGHIIFALHSTSICNTFTTQESWFYWWTSN